MRCSIAVLTLLSVGACNQGRDGQAYQDDAVGFRVAIPDGWKRSQEKNATVFRPAARGAASLAVTAVAKRQGAIRRGWEGMRDGLLAQYAAMPGYKLHSKGTATLAGRPAFKLVVSFRHQDRDVTRMQQVVELTDHFLVMDCNGSSATPPKELCRRFFDSLEVLR